MRLNVNSALLLGVVLLGVNAILRSVDETLDSPRKKK